MCLLGIDGGGTRTTAWLADHRGRVLARAEAGPSNPLKVGVAASRRALLGAAQDALRQARLKPRSLEAVCVGLGGVGQPAVHRRMLAWLRRALPARRHLLTTDAALEAVTAATSGRRGELCGPSGLHADSKLVFAEPCIELIVGFALQSGGRVCRLPTIVTGRWRGLPLGSPETWAIAYALMGRQEKAERLFAHLERRRADATAVAKLLAEPLPPELADRLRALT